MSEIRDERSHGIKERLDPSERGHLLQLRYSPGYEVLLDLIEMLCIEQETRLINAPAENEAEILAEHKMAKAFWQVFTGLQKKVATEVNIQLQIEMEIKDRDQQRDEFDEEQQILKT